ncbi:MAG: M15 family metallopeptidase, partial [Clostridia bacterium]|nr:M15 family metallopeptidase [Clostridia bacterium]
TVTSTDNPKVKANVSVTVTPYVAPDEPEITYIDGILIANKTYPLPSTYNPGGIDPDANTALNEMFAAAKEDGLNLFVRSGFRSYATQKWLYENYVAQDGKEEADRYSARPGHSEHQTGLGIDINKADSSFEGTPEAIWLAANCHKFGFIIRYPQGKEHITGYMYEPWHVRYVGMDHAPVIYEKGLCLEEYLGITSQYNY